MPEKSKQLGLDALTIPERIEMEIGIEMARYAFPPPSAFAEQVWLHIKRLNWGPKLFVRITNLPRAHYYELKKRRTKEWLEHTALTIVASIQVDCDETRRLMKLAGFDYAHPVKENDVKTGRIIQYMSGSSLGEWNEVMKRFELPLLG